MRNWRGRVLARLIDRRPTVKQLVVSDWFAFEQVEYARELLEGRRMGDATRRADGRHACHGSPLHLLPTGKRKAQIRFSGFAENHPWKRIRGAGQYTLLHHPPRKKEVEDFMLDVEKNLNKAIWELKYKFDHFVNGNITGTRADDRIAEYGEGPLRMCKYPAGDWKYMKDCKQCMIDAGQQNIREGVTGFYRGSKHTFQPTQYYKKADYNAVPIRKNVACDWSYAARRFNGAGINSYHYQTIIQRNLLAL